MSSANSYPMFPRSSGSRYACWQHWPLAQRSASSAAAGLGQITVAILGTVLGLVVLVVFRRLEKQLGLHDRADRENHHHPSVTANQQDDE